MDEPHYTAATLTIRVHSPFFLFSHVYSLGIAVKCSYGLFLSLNRVISRQTN